MKLRIKIPIGLILAAVTSAIIIGLIGVSFGKRTIEREAYDKLTAIRELKANRIEAYFDFIRNQMLSFSSDFMVSEAMEEFQVAFNDLSTVDETTVSAMESSLSSYYIEQFLTRINANDLASHALEQYYPASNRAKFLQYHYISANENDVGSKHLLDKAGFGDTYSEVHARYHSQFRKYLERFGYYDIFLVNLEGDIVYSVYKEVDFATNLLTDAYAGSNFSEVVRAALESSDPDYLKLVDFEPYPPSYNGHASFIASPIYGNDEKLGVLVFQLPIDRINNIMTDNLQWEKVGLGKSGETYIVGEDLLLRNQSRFLIEDKDNYLGMLNEIGTPEDIISQIDNLDNSIGLQKVESPGVTNALKGDTGTMLFNDYRGVMVLSSYRPLTIDDVDWVIMSEVDQAEAFEGVSRFIRQMIIWSVLILLLIPIVSFYFSSRLVGPLGKLTEAARQMAGGDLDTKTGIKSDDEIGVLASSFDSMSASIRKMMTDLELANETLEERVRARTKEVELAHNEINSIIENAHDGIISIDERQTILSINPAACKMFGYEYDEVLGQSLLMLLPDHVRDNHHHHVRSFKESKDNAKPMTDRPDIDGKRKNGAVFPVEVSISKQETDGSFRFTAFVKDITERREAEERIRISENMFRSISASASDAIISANKDGVIEFWNDAAEVIFGYSKQEALGKDLKFIVPDRYQEQHDKGMDRVRSGGDKHVIGNSVEMEAVHKSGAEIPIELSLSHWEGQDGMNFSAILRDISERKAMEQEVAKAHERMEQELQVGRDIQMSMLPLIFPAFPDHSEFNIFAMLESAREVGGDFYDFYFLDEHRFLFTVADVSGKGVGSALFMAVCKTLLKSRASEDFSTSSIATHVNEELSSENNSAMFVTLFLCVIDLKSGMVTYTNAGHNPPYIKRVNGEIVTLNTLHGPPIAALEDFAYGQDTVKLEINDFFILFTDGVNEAMNEKRELYSDNRIIELLKDYKSDNIETCVKDLYESVIAFQGTAEQADDITILGFEYLEPLAETILFSETVTLKNELSEIDRLNTAFNEFCEQHDVGLKVYTKFNIAFDELINNIISYAYKDNKHHLIEVTFNLSKTDVRVTIEDDGIAFNPLNLATPDTTLEAEDRDIGGLGIHLVRNLMDNVSYKRLVKKNLTTLIKNIN